MRLLIIAIAIALSACDSDQERQIKAMEKQIRMVIQSDWHAGIPLNGLTHADKLCKENPSLHGCNTVRAQLDDIAITLASCEADQRSDLCRAMVRAIGKHFISSLLSKAQAARLPHMPFYWNLPTTALEAQAANFEYRREAASWWWETWRTIILSCIALFTMGFAVWFLWTSWAEARKKHAEIISFQRAEEIKQEGARRIQQGKVRIEAQRKARLASDAAIAEQARITAEEMAKQQAAEAAARLAAEQTEASLLLKAAFVPAKGKRRKDASSP